MVGVAVGVTVAVPVVVAVLVIVGAMLGTAPIAAADDMDFDFDRRRPRLVVEALPRRSIGAVHPPAPTVRAAVGGVRAAAPLPLQPPGIPAPDPWHAA